MFAHNIYLLFFCVLEEMTFHLFFVYYLLPQIIIKKVYIQCMYLNFFCFKKVFMFKTSKETQQLKK